ncbi:penicillin-binding protein 2 [Branchiibius hedensis]|uniref:Penicillin-binding protein 2 n=1 Tax=Branchiibius hedensis TaxID=672460 RepID=A0A2Y8ZNA2_9MICO|nr:penicillin-binding protein 2 [Branchiibius hedensis]SSA33435.1 penicillin-binding protein 2 [Branchiibius hedensis]
MNTRSAARLVVVLAVTVVVCAGLILRLGQVQLTDATPGSALLGQNATRSISVTAPRGQIQAADGTVLVGNSLHPVLTISPTVLADQADGGRQLLTRVARELAVPAEDLIGRSKVCGTKGAAVVPLCFSGSPVAPIPIMDNPPMTQVLGMLERPADFPGLALQQIPERSYPQDHPGGINLAQVLGYLGSVNQAELTADPALTAQDVVGRAGLELTYNAALQGTPGTVTYAVDDRGLPISVAAQTPAVQGDTVRTHLITALQHRSEAALAAGLTKAKAPAGAVVVLDASDGGVVAMTSQPTYDPAVWTGGISQAEYTKISNALSNRAVSEVQPPGSTFKAVTLPGAIAAGASPSGSYSCPSSVRIGNREFTNFESESYGSISMTTALEVSCDTVFYRWAYQQWQKEGGLAASPSTTSPFAVSARDFHLGQRTGVDLPAEAAGLIPDRAWKLDQWQQTKTQICARAAKGYPEITDKARAAYLTAVAKENCASGYQWQPGDAVNFVIGQGSVSVTPLQLAVAYGAIANGGTLWQPHVAAATISAAGKTQPVAAVRTGSVTLSAAARTTLETGLCEVTAGSRGTAFAAFRGFDLSTYRVCGKTGTAEVFGKQPTSWFVSYGPKTAGGHQYVVAVMLEQAGTGADAAAPVARQIWDLLRTLG